MDLLQLLQDLIANLADLQAKLADAEASLAAAKQASFDEGFAAGVASVPVSGDLKFSQADLDAAVAAAVGPLNDQIAAMQAQLDGVPGQIADAVSALKAELAQKYADALVDDIAFADLLK